MSDGVDTLKREASVLLGIAGMLVSFAMGWHVAVFLLGITTISHAMSKYRDQFRRAQIADQALIALMSARVERALVIEHERPEAQA